MSETAPGERVKIIKSWCPVEIDAAPVMPGRRAIEGMQIPLGRRVIEGVQTPPAHARERVCLSPGGRIRRVSCGVLYWPSAWLSLASVKRPSCLDGQGSPAASPSRGAESWIPVYSFLSPVRRPAQTGRATRRPARGRGLPRQAENIGTARRARGDVAEPRSDRRPGLSCFGDQRAREPLERVTFFARTPSCAGSPRAAFAADRRASRPSRRRRGARHITTSQRHNVTTSQRYSAALTRQARATLCGPPGALGRSSTETRQPD